MNFLKKASGRFFGGFLKGFLYSISFLGGLVAASGTSSYQPKIDFSNSQRSVQIVYVDRLGAIPSNAIPSNALPSSAIPSNAIPSNAIPSNALPSSALPSLAIPSNAIPSNFIQGVKFQRLPDFGEAICGSGRCTEQTAYVYQSDQPGPELAGPPVPLEPLTVEIWADAYSLEYGSCTSIHWSVTGASQVWYEGGAVPADGEATVCPSKSTSYSVDALSPDNNRKGSVVEIEVREESVVEIGPQSSSSSGVVVDVPQNDSSTGSQGSNEEPVEPSGPGVEYIPPQTGPVVPQTNQISVKFMNMDERGRDVCSLFFRISGSSDWGQNYITGELPFARKKSVSLPHSGIYDVQYTFCVSQSETGVEQAVSPYTLYNESLYDGAIIAVAP